MSKRKRIGGVEGMLLKTIPDQLLRIHCKVGRRTKEGRAVFEAMMILFQVIDLPKQRVPSALMDMARKE